MRVLVVYESMYGNTHVVASDIADGLRAAHEVTLVPVAGATADLVAEADLLVVGAPTHMRGLSTGSSRQAASGELPGDQAEHPGRRGVLAGP
jgi:flavodoxin